MPENLYPDTLIIGAGPSGLTLACELLKRGLTIRIVDQNEKPTDQSRALGLHSRTLEIFEKMGVLKPMLEQGRPIDHIEFHEKGRSFKGPSLSILDTPHPFILVLPQAVTEKILTSHLESLGGRVERSIEAYTIEEGKAILRYPDSRQESVFPKWIIGCDGAHSTVRHALNLSFEGGGFPQNFVLADVVLKTSLDLKAAHAFLSLKGLFFVVPLPLKDHFRLIATFPQNFTEKEFSCEFLESTARERTSLPLQVQKTLWTSLFTIHERIVPIMSKGSIFLCGDAAHIHSPIGGQGLNISVQDAFNLAWKLALVHQKKAPGSLLETYNEERYPVAKKVIRGTTIATWLLTLSPKSFWLGVFRMLLSLFHFPYLRKRFVYTISQLSTNYRNSSIVSQPFRDIFRRGPRPGDRAPFFSDSQETRHILLVFGALDFKPPLSVEQVALQHVELNSPLAYAFKAKKPCLYLIRPDGYVAFRMSRLNLYRNELKTQVF